jgi:hypothetical protein
MNPKYTSDYWIILIPWLLVSEHSLASVCRYSGQEQVLQLYRREEWDKQSNDLTVTEQVWRFVAFCSGCNAPTLFRNLTKKSLTCMECGPLLTRYSLWYTVRLSEVYPDTLTIERAGHPIRHLWTRWAVVPVGLSSVNFSSTQLRYWEIKCRYWMNLIINHRVDGCSK